MFKADFGSNFGWEPVELSANCFELSLIDRTNDVAKTLREIRKWSKAIPLKIGFTNSKNPDGGRHRSTVTFTSGPGMGQFELVRVPEVGLKDGGNDDALFEQNISQKKIEF